VAKKLRVGPPELFLLLFLPLLFLEPKPTEFATEFMAELAVSPMVLATELTVDIVLLIADVTGFVAVVAGGSSMVGMEGMGTEPPEKRDPIAKKI